MRHEPITSSPPQLKERDFRDRFCDRTQVLITFLDPGKIDPTKVRQLIDQLTVDDLDDLGDSV